MTPAQTDWARCRDWIRSAVDKDGSYSIGAVEAFIEDGVMTFWPGKYCAAVTEFATVERFKSLHVYAGGGATGKALAELYRMEPSFIAYARHHGCSKIRFMCRPDGEAAARRKGYEKIFICMSKDI